MDLKVSDVDPILSNEYNKNVYIYIYSFRIFNIFILNPALTLKRTYKLLANYSNYDVFSH